MCVLGGGRVMGRGCARPHLISLAPALLPLIPSLGISPGEGRVPWGLGVAANDLAA